MFRKLSGKRAFTLLETLIAVAIIIVMLGITAVSYASFKDNLTITQNDNYARSLYLAAQNRIVAMKSSGELYNFLNELQAGYIDRELSKKPQDFDSNDDSWKNLYYLYSSDEITDRYIMSWSPVTNSIADGTYIIELEPYTGNIYGVFYRPKAFTYDDVTSLLSRSLAFRKRTSMIGYYGGSYSKGITIGGFPDIFAPELTVINKEELYLKISCPNLSEIIQTNTQQLFSITLTVTDEHEGIYTRTYHGGTDFMVDSDTLNFNIILDSMRNGYSFEEITGLTPGDDLTVKVTADYTCDDFTINTPDSLMINRQSGINSLFASKDKTNNIINVSYLRQLNNLRESRYRYTGTSAVTVNVTCPIYFDYASWTQGDEISPDTPKQNQLEYFVPIKNTNLFGSQQSSGFASFDGDNLYHFVISPGESTVNTGLFDETNCNLSNTYLIDPIVTGSGSTGALAGTVWGGTINSCGVYLTTSNWQGNPYSLDIMSWRVKQFKVATTGSNAGGLIGYSSGALVSNSFGAIYTSAAGSNAGGLIGNAVNSNISAVYSSGEISVSSVAGGIAGLMNGCNLSNCYSTSNISCDSYTGGIAGHVTGSILSNCRAYGYSHKSDGTINTVTSGGIAGYTLNSNYSDCVYLIQEDYNDHYDPSKIGGTAVTGIRADTYAALKVDGNSASNSFPYLFGEDGESSVFPFRMVVQNHYGDWPTEYVLKTCLVYYEKYSDGQYGYYAVTGKVSDAYTSTNWVLNTLRDEYCIDDGYALLSIYDLKSFVYSLNSGASNSIEIVYDNAGVGKALLINRPAKLTLNANGDSFDVLNPYIYQLPFDLQETARDTTARFFDELVVSGYSETDSSLPVFDNYKFYYCPHFAKNAINQAIADTAIDYPDTPSEIYVRSPRHLNALGRFSYYWNTNNTPLTDTVTYVQETDLDFSKYTKNYCGIYFDLMDTSAGFEYHNVPIGRPMTGDGAITLYDKYGNAYSPGNFQHNYDGRCNKIVDFCLDTYLSDHLQFVGLFGEAYIGAIKNVVMIASDPENESAHITSRFYSTSLNGGVGALAGLAYSQGSNTMMKVTNCSVSGYVVAYLADGSTNAPNSPGSSMAVGGLIGYNMATVTNCSAVCKRVEAVVSNDNSKSISLGGITGSNCYNSISKCYSGGELYIYAGICNAQHTIGGIAGKRISIYPSWSSGYSISNCYTYCQASCSIPSGSYGRVSAYGIGNENISYTYYNSDVFGLTVTSGTGTAETGDALKTLSISGFGTALTSYPWSRYLTRYTFPYPAALKNNDGAYVHYGNWPFTVIRSAFLVYYEQYSDGTFGLYYTDLNGVLINTLDYSNAKTISASGYGILSNDACATCLINGKPVSASLLISGVVSGYNLYMLNDTSDLEADTGSADKELVMTFDVSGFTDSQTFYVNGDFAAAITSDAGQLAGTGFPLEVRTASQLQRLAYLSSSAAYLKQTHNITASSAAGLYLCPNLISGFDYNGNGQFILSSGITVFGQISGNVHDLTVSGSNVTSYAVFANINRGTISGCVVENSSMSASNVTYSAVFAYENYGTISSCRVSECDSQSYSGNIAGFVYKNYTDGSITSSCVVSSDLSSNNYCATGFAYYNYGNIESCYVSPALRGSSHSGLSFDDLVISGKTACGFAFDCTGTIVGCYTVSAVTATGGNSAGFVSSCSGSVSDSYANCLVTGTTSAEGFMNSGTAYGCYSCGSVSASGTVTGFIVSGSATNCYSLSILSGSSENGFGPLGVTATNCVWIKDVSYNEDVSSGTGSPVTFSTLGSRTGAGTVAAYTFDSTLSNIYPYVPAGSLEHYGDYPIAIERRGYIGIEQISKAKTSYVRYMLSYDLEQDILTYKNEPIIPGSGNKTIYYLFVSNDIMPEYKGDWTIYCSNGATISSSYSTVGNYRYYRMTVPTYGTEVYFYNGDLSFSIYISEQDGTNNTLY